MEPVPLKAPLLNGVPVYSFGDCPWMYPLSSSKLKSQYTKAFRVKSQASAKEYLVLGGGGGR